MEDISGLCGGQNHPPSATLATVSPTYSGRVTAGFRLMGASRPLHQRHLDERALWQPRMSSGLSPQPPDRLAKRLGAQGKRGARTPQRRPHPLAGVVGGHAGGLTRSRLPQRLRLVTAFTPTRLRQPHSPPRARKPDGVDAHCARQERRHLCWPAGRPWRPACALAVRGSGRPPRLASAPR